MITIAPTRQDYEALWAECPEAMLRLRVIVLARMVSELQEELATLKREYRNDEPPTSNDGQAS